MSLFYKGRRETPSRCRGECVSLPYREDDILLLSLCIGECVPLLYREDDLLLLCAEERVCSPHRGESVPLLSVEEADSFSVQRRECLLSTEDTPYVEMQRKYKPRELQNTGIRYITSTRDTRDVRDIRGTPASVWRNTYEIQAKRASEPKVYTYTRIHYRTGRPPIKSTRWGRPYPPPR